MGKSNVESMILKRTANILVPLALPFGNIKHQVESEIDKKDLRFPEQTEVFPIQQCNVKKWR